MRLRCLLRIAQFVPATAATMCTPLKDDVSASPTVGGGIEAGPMCDVDAMFGAPVEVPGLEPSTVMATSVGGMRLSPDYQTAYFQATNGPDNVAYGYDDLYTASRDSPVSPFAYVALMVGSGVNTPADQFDPTVSGDGLTLVFASGKPAGDPVHLYYGVRALKNDPFTGMGPMTDVNDLGATYDESPFLSEDGQVLYFASSRVAANSVDVYRSQRQATIDSGLPVFGKPVAVDRINTTFSEIAPVVTPDDLVIYFASDRTDANANGQYHIWMASRNSKDDPFPPPTNVSELNSSATELPTFVTRDRCVLYFASTRSQTLKEYQATKPSR
jgi:ribosomal protein L24E